MSGLKLSQSQVFSAARAAPSLPCGSLSELMMALDALSTAYSMKSCKSLNANFSSSPLLVSSLASYGIDSPVMKHLTLLLHTHNPFLVLPL